MAEHPNGSKATRTPLALSLLLVVQVKKINSCTNLCIDCRATGQEQCWEDAKCSQDLRESGDVIY